MSGEFDFPSGAALVDESKTATLPWLQVFARWQQVIVSARQSGTTANRPVTGLWIGRQYFDTTLGLPVWVQSAAPVVWCDATGAPR